MSIVQLFNLPLPDDVVRYLSEFLSLSIGDLLVLREVNKEYKEFIDRIAGNRLMKLKSFFRSASLHLRDPIYSDIRDFIPASGSFTLSDLKRLKSDHLERHFTFKNLSPEKLDRVFGYMLENRLDFVNILPQIPDDNFFIGAWIPLNYRKNFREYMLTNLMTDSLFIKFMELLHAPESVSYDIPFATVSQYYDKSGKKVSQDSNISPNNVLILPRRHYHLYNYAILEDVEFSDRFMHSVLILLYSFFVDVKIIISILKVANLFFALKDGIFFSIFSAALITVICLYKSPTFAFFLALEKSIYQTPSMREFLIDMIALVSKTFNLLALLGLDFTKRNVNHIAEIAPETGIAMFRPLLRFLEMVFLEHHDLIERQARERAALRNRNRLT